MPVSVRGPVGREGKRSMDILVSAENKLCHLYMPAWTEHLSSCEAMTYKAKSSRARSWPAVTVGCRPQAVLHLMQ